MQQIDPSLQAVFQAHPAWQPLSAPRPAPPALDVDGNPPPLQQLIADGWAVALIEPNSIQPDGGAGLTRGVIGLSNQGPLAQARRLGRAARLGLGCQSRPGLY